MALHTFADGNLNFAAAYKELFPQIRLDQLANTGHPFMSQLPKKDDLVGDGIHVPIRYSKPQGKGAVFSNAQNQAVEGKSKRVFLERKRYYGVVQLDDEAIRAARDRNGSFYGVKETEIEDMVTELGETLAMHLWLKGWGTLGVVSSVATNVITLTNPEDTVNFRLGQTIVGSDAESGGSLNGTSTTVTAIDYDAGTVTLASAAAISAGAADFLFNGGDYYTGGTTVGDGLLVTGLAGWIPETAESSGTFLGMSRTDDIVRLQGWRQAYLGSIEETIKKQNSVMRRIGARPDQIWMADANWHRLEMELGSRAVREEGKDTPFGITSLKYSTPGGLLRVMADPYCPEDVGYQLKRDTWTLHHLDGLPHIIVTDSLRSLRLATSDGIEIRARMWCELACNAPFHNGRFAIS